MQTPAPKVTYEIVDRQTGAIVGRCNSLRAALRSVDRRDNEYGACRYSYRRVEAV